MSPPERDLIADLHEAVPFDPVPLRRGLPTFHVPFEELVPGSRVETELRRVMTGHSLRAAVSGPSGCGKSSLIWHGAHLLEDEVAVLRVPVEAENDAVVETPGAFAGHMIRELARQAEAAGTISGQEAARERELSALRERRERRRGASGRVGLPSWLSRAELAAEAHGVLGVEVDRSTAEVIDTLAQLIGVIEAHGLRAVVVLDDSDAWLDTGVGRRAHLVAPFFGRVLPELVEELSCGWVVAVHDHYFEKADFPHGAGALPTRIAIPALQHSEAIARILGRRIQECLDAPDASVADVFEPAAVEALFSTYRQAGGNLRIPMQYAHAALEIAHDDGVPLINDRHVHAAAARFGHA